MSNPDHIGPASAGAGRDLLQRVGAGALLDHLAAMALAAGEIVMEVYATNFGVEDKGGNDPVTVADKRANALLCEELARAYPGVPIVAEESPPSSYASFGEAAAAFFVDPLDGTREFVARNGEFAVMIGLAQGGRSVAGVVFAPARGLLWAGAEGVGAFEQDSSGKRRPLSLAGPLALADARLVVSRSRRGERLERMLARQPAREVIPMGSAGVKSASVARGDADAYVQLGGAGCLWDSCAPEAVVRAVGGTFTDQLGQRIAYDAAEVQLRNGVVAAEPLLHAALLEAIALT
jgi:3'(2'), 5'-bisphosphate nucleotidase